MMTLKMMGLTPGPLVCALSLFALNNPLVVLTTPLVVFVASVLAVFVSTEIESIGDVFTFIVFIPIGVESKGGRLIELF